MIMIKKYLYTYFKAPQKILCFRQPEPTYQNWPTVDFLQKYHVFLVGVFIIEVSILKKNQQPTLPKVLRPLP